MSRTTLLPRGELSRMVSVIITRVAHWTKTHWRKNTSAWTELKLHYRVLAGVGDREMGTTVLGQRIISMPICVAPILLRQASA